MTGLELGAGDRVTAVLTARERIACGAAVNALGSVGAAVMADTGFALPVDPFAPPGAATVPTTRAPRPERR